MFWKAENKLKTNLWSDKSHVLFQFFFFYKFFPNFWNYKMLKTMTENLTFNSLFFFLPYCTSMHLKQKQKAKAIGRTAISSSLTNIPILPVNWHLAICRQVSHTSQFYLTDSYVLLFVSVFIFSSSDWKQKTLILIMNNFCFYRHNSS